MVAAAAARPPAIPAPALDEGSAVQGRCLNKREKQTQEIIIKKTYMNLWLMRIACKNLLFFFGCDYKFFLFRHWELAFESLRIGRKHDFYFIFS